jgi:hypothetical protein
LSPLDRSYAKPEPENGIADAPLSIANSRVNRSQSESLCTDSLVFHSDRAVMRPKTVLCAKKFLHCEEGDFVHENLHQNKNHETVFCIHVNACFRNIDIEEMLISSALLRCAEFRAKNTEQPKVFPCQSKYARAVCIDQK